MRQKLNKKRKKKIRSFILLVLSIILIAIMIFSLIRDNFFIFAMGIFFLSIVITLMLPIREATDNVYLKTTQDLGGKKKLNEN